jgi:plastocyanin
MIHRQPSSALASLTALVLLILVLGVEGCGGTQQTDPPTAGPQTWIVAAGGSAQSEAVQALDFYPNSITIHAGDSVTWSNATSIPHMVAIPPSGQTPPPGPPNPSPVGGNVFDDTAYISSGFLVKGKSYTVKFPRPGTYAYYCLIHRPEMTGKIAVIPAGMPLPMSAAQYAAAASADLANDLQAGITSIQSFPFTSGGMHLAAGIAPGLSSAKPSQSTVVRFLDDKTLNNTITVPVGTTVTWTNESNNVPHTVTFPAAGQAPPGGPPGQVPPSGGSTYDGTALANSGVLQPGASYSLTFTKAGTFTYYCLFHDGPTGMIGTVTVQ